jgi:hypothetical protein
MNTHLLEGLSHVLKVSYFDFINKKESIKLCYEKLDLYQDGWKKKKGHNRGGIVSSTYDTLHALFACIAPTMEDIRKKQPDLFIESVEKGHTFAFVYRTSLAAKINKGSKAAKLDVKTISKQINRLIEAGIIIEKRNYSTRFEIDKEGKRRQVNPFPSDLNPSGRGHVQLILAPSVLVFTSKYNQFKASLKNTIPLYGVNSLFINTSINKSTIDKPTVIDNQKASAIAEGDFKIIKNKEQERQLSKKSKVSPRQFDSKKDFTSHQLLELCRSRFFDERTFTDAIEKGSIQAIDDRIKQAIEAVEAYNSEKIRTYTAREKYKNCTRKHWMLAQYRKKLPTPYRAAIEIMSFAIQKQEKNALSKGYMSKIKRYNNDPMQLITSSNFQYALNYSISDWTKINDSYFIKNKSYSAYCNIVGMVGKMYTYILDLSYQSPLIAYSESLQACRKLRSSMLKNTDLTKSSIKAIDAMIKTKFAPLFKSLTPDEKERVRLAAKRKTA